MKLKLPRLLKSWLCAIMGAGLAVSGCVSQAGVMSYAVPLQVYLDMGSNLAGYFPGASGVVIPYTVDGLDDYVLFLMPDFRPSTDNGAFTLVSPTLIATVNHNGMANGTFSARYMGNTAYNYSSAGIRNDTLFLWNNTNTDFKVDRSTRLVTDAPAAVVCTDESIMANLKGQLIYRMGGGGMALQNADGSITGLNGPYEILTAGICYAGTSSYNATTGVLGFTVPSLLFADDINEKNPLPFYLQGGDSGSACYIWNSNTSQFEYIGSAQAISSAASYAGLNSAYIGKVSDAITAKVQLDSSHTAITWGAATTTGALKANMDPMLAVSRDDTSSSTVTYSGDGTRVVSVSSAGGSANLYAGVISDGTHSTEYVGVNVATQGATWSNLNLESATWYSYASSLMRLAIPTVFFTQDVKFTAATASYEITINGNVDTGVGIVTFDRGNQASATFTLKANGAATLDTAGWVINSGVTVISQLTGNSDEWRAIGDGTLRIQGTGNNYIGLNVGGSLTTILERTGGYAAYNVLINMGATVGITNVGQIGNNLTFGSGGGVLNLMGNSITWASTGMKGAGANFAINMLDPGAVIANYSAGTTSTLTYTIAGNSTVQGSFRDNGTSSLQVIYNSAGTLNLTGQQNSLTGANSGLVIQQGKVVLSGAQTKHASTSGYSQFVYYDDDWQVAKLVGNVQVNSGATWEVGAHGDYAGIMTVSGRAFLRGGALVAGTVTVANGGYVKTDFLSGMTGNLTMQNNSTMEMWFDSSFATDNAGFNLNGGTLSATGTNNILLYVPGVLTEGIYTMFTAGGLNVGSANFVITGQFFSNGDSRQIAQLLAGSTEATKNNLYLHLTGNIESLTWAGNSSSKWTTKGGLAPWTGATDKQFYATDRVTFDSTHSSDVVISGNVTPTSVLITGGTYAFKSDAGNAGRIIGNGYLQITGGTVTLDTANTYTGGTIIEGGTLTLLANGSLGTGSVTQTGGTFVIHNATQLDATKFSYTGGILDVRGLNFGLTNLHGNGERILFGTRTLTITNSQDTVWGGVLTGTTGTVQKSGSGTLTLTGTMEMATSTLNVAGGKVLLTKSIVLGGLAMGHGTTFATDSTATADTLLKINGVVNLGASGANTYNLGLAGNKGSLEIATLAANYTATININQNVLAQTFSSYTASNVTLAVAAGITLTANSWGLHLNQSTGVVQKTGSGTLVIHALNNTGTFSKDLNVVSGTLIFDIATGVTATQGGTAISKLTVATGVVLQKTGAGVLVLGNANNYIDARLQLLEGTVRLTNNGGAGLGGATVRFDGGTLQLNGGAQELRNNLTIGTGGKITGTTELTLSGTFNMTSTKGTGAGTGMGSIDAGNADVWLGWDLGFNFMAGTDKGATFTLLTTTGTMDYQISPDWFIIIGLGPRQGVDWSATTSHAFIATITNTAANLTWKGGSGSWGQGTNVGVAWNSTDDIEDKFFHRYDYATIGTGADTVASGGTLTLASDVEIGKLLVTGAANWTIAGTQKITGEGGLQKDGTGSLTINTANDFWGGTKVTAGTLNATVAGALGGTATNKSSLAVQGGTVNVSAAQANLGATTITGGHLVVTGTGTLGSGQALSIAGGKLTVGGTGAGMSLNMGDTTVGNNATFVLRVGTPLTDVLNMGAFTYTGTSGMDLQLTLTSAGTGSYLLMTSTDWKGLSTSVFHHNLIDTPRQSYSLGFGAGGNPNGLYLIVTGSVAELVWRGTATENVWYAGNGGGTGVKNWDKDGTADWFYDTDHVAFDGSDSARSIIISGAVDPTSISVSGGAYTFTSADAGSKIAGEHTTLTVENGSLTLNSANDLGGLTTVGVGGSLVLNVAGALGGGGLTLNGGTVTVATANALGTGVLTVNSGTVSLNNAQSVSGVIIKAGGSVVLSSATALGTGAIISGSGTLVLNMGTANRHDAGLVLTGMVGGTLHIQSGRLTAGAAANYAVGTMKVTNGGQFYSSGGTWAQTWELQGTGWTGTDAATTGAVRWDATIINGAINLAGDTWIGVNTGTTTINGAVTASNANTALSKTMAGVLVLGTSATLDAKISALELLASRSGDGTMLGAGTLSFATGTLNNVQNIKFSVGVGATTRTGTLQWATGNADSLSQAITIDTNFVATFNTNGNNVSILGAVSGGGTLTKAGAGSLTFAVGSTVALGAIANNSVVANAIILAGSATLGSFTGTTVNSSTTTASYSVAATGNVLVTGNMILHNEFASTLANGERSVMNVAGKLTVGGYLALARDGKGIVNVNDGGLLVANSIILASNAAWNATDGSKLSQVNLNTGGTLVLGAGGMVGTGSGLTGDNQRQFILNGGTLASSVATQTINIAGTQVTVRADANTTINTSLFSTATGQFASSTANITLANSISGNGGLTVAGMGTLTLSAANTFVGGITMTSGTLNATVANALGAGGLTVNGGTVNVTASQANLVSTNIAGGKVAVASSISLANNVTIRNSGKLSMGSTGGVARALTVGSLSLYDGAIIELRVGAIGTDTITMGAFNWLSGDGKAALEIHANSTLALGTYNLFTSTTGWGDWTNTDLANHFTLTGDASVNAARQGYTLSFTSANTVGLIVTGDAQATLTWASTNNGTWRVADSASNWTSADTLDTKFHNADKVIFTAVGAGVVRIEGDVNPDIITVASGVYEFAAHATNGGRIVGTATSLTIANGAVLTTDMVNTYGGGTTINGGGLLIAKSTGALGTGTTTVQAGGKLTADGVDFAGTVAGTAATSYLKNANNGAFVGSLAGSFGIAVGDSLTLAGSTGGSFTNNGTLNLIGATTAALTLTNGSTLNLIGINTTGVTTIAGGNMATIAGAGSISGGIANSGTLLLGGIINTGIITANAGSVLTTGVGGAILAGTTVSQAGNFTLGATGAGNMQFATLVQQPGSNFTLTVMSNVEFATLSKGGYSPSFVVSAGVSLILGDVVANANSNERMNISGGGTLVIKNWTTATKNAFNLGAGSTLEFNLVAATNIDYTIANGTATNITGSGRLVKSGDGTLTLSGTMSGNTYSGGTVVTAGTLNAVVANALGAGSLTVQSGTVRITEAQANLGGTTVTGGNLIVSGAGTLGANKDLTLSGGSLTLGVSGDAMTLTVGSLSLGGGAIIDMRAGISGTDCITMGSFNWLGGDTGNVVLSIHANTAFRDGASYLLFASDTAWGWTNADLAKHFTLAGDAKGDTTRQDFELLFGTGDTAKNVYLSVTLDPGDLVWATTNNGTWAELDNANNWTSTEVSDTRFHHNDHVFFTTAGAGDVTLSGDVSPGTITIDSGDYVFAADSVTGGQLMGMGTSLTVNAGASLTMNLANAIGGAVTLNGGTLIAGHDNSLGTGAVAMNGGVLNLGGFAVNNAITTSTGAGTNMITHAEAYTGKLTVGANTTLIGDLGAGAASLQIDSGAMLTWTGTASTAGSMFSLSSITNNGLLHFDLQNSSLAVGDYHLLSVANYDAWNTTSYSWNFDTVLRDGLGWSWSTNADTLILSVFLVGTDDFRQTDSAPTEDRSYNNVVSGTLMVNPTISVAITGNTIAGDVSVAGGAVQIVGGEATNVTGLISVAADGMGGTAGKLKIEGAGVELGNATAQISTTDAAGKSVIRIDGENTQVSYAELESGKLGTTAGKLNAYMGSANITVHGEAVIDGNPTAEGMGAIVLGDGASINATSAAANNVVILGEISGAGALANVVTLGASGENTHSIGSIGQGQTTSLYNIEVVASGGNVLVQNTSFDATSSITVGASGTVELGGTISIAARPDATITSRFASQNEAGGEGEDLPPEVTVDFSFLNDDVSVAEGGVMIILNFADLGASWTELLAYAFEHQGDLCQFTIDLGAKIDGNAAFGFLGVDYGYDVVMGKYEGQGLYSATVTYVPEPTTATLGMLGLAGLLLRRRRTGLVKI